MMKRVGVTRLPAAGPDDQPPLIITAGPQVFLKRSTRFEVL